MANLASILTDPNYVNANEATKQAIFDKFSAQDPNFTKANPATQDAIRQKFGVSMAAAPSAPAILPSAEAVGEGIPGARQMTTGQRMYQAVRPYVAPTVEALGAIGGGLLGGTAGTFGAGPVGTVTGGVAGAGLGYGIAKEALETADVAMGMKPPRTGAALVAEPARNILEGATLEAGGRVVAPVLGKIVSKIADIRNVPVNKAAKLARNALGPDLDQAVNALRNASPNASVAEVTANVQNPTWQALIRDSLEQSPAGAQYLNKFRTMSQEEGVNALANLAGGATAAEVRGTAAGMKEMLTDITSPARQAALNRANLGQRVAQFEAEAGKLSKEAADQVQKVRDLIKAGDLAGAAARLEVVRKGVPVGFAKYTYKGELARMADDWASKAADASLDLGQGARFAKSAADTMREAGIKPLKADEIIGNIRSIANNPEFAGNDVLMGAVKNVADDIAKWTNSGGVIDAKALDAIRKNSINAAIQQLRPGVDATIQRNLAAEVTGKLKPILVDTIENAGGKGYRAYLEEYSKGMQQIAEKKLTGEALRLWKTDKDGFVRLVQNESPEVVERFLGPGNYNIATELSENVLTTLQSQVDKRLSQLAASKQASDGEKALTTLLRENTSKFRLPSWLSFWGAAVNKTIGELEKAVGSRTMKILADAMQSPQGAVNLLERLPASERNRVLQIISDPSVLGAGAAGSKTAQKAAEAIRTGTAVGSVNMLAPERNNNALNEPARIVETQ